MTQQAFRSRIYIGLFLFILLIVIPYFLGGLSGIVGTFIFVVLAAAVLGLVNQIWRLSFLRQFQSCYPTANLFVKGLLIGIILVALLLMLSVALIPPMSGYPFPLQ